MTSNELLCLPCLDTFDAAGSWRPIEIRAITVTLTGAMCRMHVQTYLQRQRDEQLRQRELKR